MLQKLKHERFLSLSSPPCPATTLERNHQRKCLQIPELTALVMESSPVIHSPNGAQAAAVQVSELAPASTNGG